MRHRLRRGRSGGLRRAARRLGSIAGLVVLGSCAASAAGSVPAHAQAAGGKVTPPAVLTRVDATYPASALTTRKHADVVLKVTVDQDGHVTEVEVMQSGGADLDEAAVVAARQWTFVPAQRDGRPVASRIRVPFHFAPPEPEVVPEAPPPVPDVVPARTEPAQTEPARAPDAAQDEITVRGAAPPPSRGASDFVLPVGELSRVPHANASDVLKLAPGIVLANEGGEGHAEQIFVRGFDAGDGQDLELSVDGVPINESGNLHGNGYADTHFIIPELVHSLRVVEGPFDPQQGNYAVAGSASYELGLDQRGLTAKYTLGSWGTQRLLFLWGPEGDSTRTFGGIELYGTDGFGSDRKAKRASAQGQYEGHLGKHGHYRLSAQGYATHYQSAGALREDDYLAGRVGFYDSYASTSFAGQQAPLDGDSSRFSLAAAVDSPAGATTFTQQVFAVKRSMRVVENFTGYLTDVQQPQAQRGDIDEQAIDELTVGARGSSRSKTRAIDETQELELGYFARGDWVRGKQQRLEAATGIPYATEADLEAQLGDLGLYADAALRPTRWATLRGGLRGDLFEYSVNHGSSTSNLALLPRSSLIFGPFDDFSLSLSYGHGVRSVDPVDVARDESTPFTRIVAYEGGVSWVKTTDVGNVSARSVFFQMQSDGELVFDSVAARNVLAGGTTRTGWAGLGRFTGDFLDSSASLTLVRSTFDDTHEPVPSAPGVVLRSDSALFSELPLRIAGRVARGALAGGITYVGPRAMPSGQHTEAQFTLDASATLTWAAFELSLSATNLLGTRVRLGESEYESDFHAQPQPTLATQRHFTAAAPRGLFASLSVHLGGS